MNKQQQQAYGYGHGQCDVVPGYCCFHPREVVVGVCAHCLKDRLLLLLAAANSNAGDDAVRRRSRSRSRSRSSSISLPKVFALGSSFLQRLDSRHHHRGRGDPDNNCYSDDDDDDASVASLDDSFISIKFEDNGKATWDSQSQHKAAAEEKADAESGKPAAAPATRSSSSSTVVVAVEHVKRGGVTRWRKQVVGRLLQLARWRRSSKAGGAAACHVSGLDGKKAAAAAERSKARGGRGWIRSLTRRRAHGDRAW